MSDALGEWDTNPPEMDPDQLAERVDVKVDVDELTPEVINDLHAHAATASHTELTTTTPDADEPPPLYYGSVDEFVREIVCPTFRRRVGERAPRRWDAQWWRNTEAILRLDAIWRAWEHHRLDPATGISDWLRDHADPQLAVLMDPDGPFKYSTDTNSPGEPLPYTPPPEGLFPDVRDGE